MTYIATACINLDSCTHDDVHVNRLHCSIYYMNSSLRCDMGQYSYSSLTMATILIAILLLTESVVADQGLASREYKAASAEWSESEDRYLFCNTSTLPKQCKFSWLYCVEEDCNHCNLQPDNIFMCNNSIGQVNLLSTYCATFNNDTENIEIGECAYNEANIHGDVKHAYVSLPHNVSELNEFMCGDLFNRTGTLCGELMQRWSLSTRVQL